LRHQRLIAPLIPALALLGTSLACSLSDVLPGRAPSPDQISTFAAATLASLASPTSEATLPPTASATPSATAPPPTPTAPPDGVSMACDGTYQRFRITDAGASVKTAWLDAWDGSTWSNIWHFEGGDPMMRQIEGEAGLYPFGDCGYLLLLPIRYSGSGAPLELHAYAWNGTGLDQVYLDDASHGVWSKEGDSIRVQGSVYLYGEPNCCPCNMQVITDTWNGSSFVETGNVITPTFSGTPPPECIP
jgi:hypothetical protein